jgi:hypothetical protein
VRLSPDIMVAEEVKTDGVPEQGREEIKESQTKGRSDTRRKVRGGGWRQKKLQD